MDHFPMVHVTPEVRFDPLLVRGNAWLRRASVDRVLKICSHLRFGPKLGIDEEELGELIVRNRDSIGTLIGAIVAREAHRSGRSPPETAVVKSGRHAGVWRKIKRNVPHARFIFMVRDPRAVVASKRATSRPYHPNETMARYGVLAAAVRWRWYSQVATRIERHCALHTIRYRDLVCEHRRTLEDLGDFLGWRVEERAAETKYRVAEPELSIHQGVTEHRDLMPAKLDEWRQTLSGLDQAVVELVCKTEMRRHGLAPEIGMGPVKSAATLTRAGIDAFRHIVQSGMPHRDR